MFIISVILHKSILGIRHFIIIFMELVLKVRYALVICEMQVIDFPLGECRDSGWRELS